MSRIDTPTPVSAYWMPDGRIELHALTPDGVLPLGKHSTPAEAWNAIDAIDLEHLTPAETALAA